MINSLKKYKYYLYLLIIPLLFPLTVLANDSIDVKCSVSNLKEPTELTINFDIVPDESNPKGASNEPKEISLKITKEDKIVNNKVDKKIYIDFTNTNYTEAGLYKYIVKEKNISNDKDYNLTKKKYEIYIQVVYDSDGNLIKNRYLFGKDLDDNEKKEITFDYVNTHEEKTVPDIPITGKTVSKVSIIVVLVIVLGFILKGLYVKND